MSLDSGQLWCLHVELCAFFILVQTLLRYVRLFLTGSGLKPRNKGPLKRPLTVSGTVPKKARTMLTTRGQKQLF